MADTGVDKLLQKSRQIYLDAVSMFNPTHIVSMVSGGRDSACSHAVAVELGIPVDLIIHGRTRCGIPQTSEFVVDYYGSMPTDFVVSDAGTAYEDYVLRKGFFGKGVAAHGFAYRVLKATPFRKTISAYIRKRKRNVRVLLLNGARHDESINREKNLQIYRRDPAQLGNIWVSLIYDWDKQQRDMYLEMRGVTINPVANTLCRSGECMCGTMQSDQERAEAAFYYPQWGEWMDNLEKEAIRLHGFGWGKPFTKKICEKPEVFQPMCTDCINSGKVTGIK
jgi:3'-phosphoadenosine 5'-phosphosulfate sulfotransferase (PAPS reductase)/FAD synthetase